MVISINENYFGQQFLNCCVRLPIGYICRAKIHHEQNKEEMDAQEQFFKNQIKSLQESRDAMENDFERIQQEECGKLIQSDGFLKPTTNLRNQNTNGHQGMNL